jgi:hypothetical protein
MRIMMMTMRMMAMTTMMVTIMMMVTITMMAMMRRQGRQDKGMDNNEGQTTMRGRQ